MQADSELAAWLRLLHTPGVGPVTARRLLAAFFSPQAIFQQQAAQLEACVSRAQAVALLQEPPDFAQVLARCTRWLEAGAQAGRVHQVLTLGDAAYPQALLHAPDPPLVLFVACHDWAWWLRSVCPLHAPLLAVVGSRNPTPQGEKNAQAFCRFLALQGWGIVSGMALGIDAAAHRAALQAGCPTLAVVGTGLDVVYPRAHAQLAQEIAACGALISEFPLGTPAAASHFPKRNRIIAGMSVGTLVVEANVQSGSLITARLALEMGREVFAIPGSIHAPQYKGCHALIKQGAQLVECADDVLSQLPVRPPPTMASGEWAQAEAAATLSQPAQAGLFAQVPPAKEAAAPASFLHALSFDPLTQDELVALLQTRGLDAAQAQAQLLEWELAGQMQRLPGGLLQRI